MTVKGYNKTILIGRLAIDPEPSEIKKNGEKCLVANFTICQTIRQNDKEEVMFHKISSFGKQAQLCLQYLHKGDLCCIEGILRNSTSVCKETGEKKYSQIIIAERITFLSSSKTKKEEPEE